MKMKGLSLPMKILHILTPKGWGGQEVTAIFWTIQDPSGLQGLNCIMQAINRHWLTTATNTGSLI